MHYPSLLILVLLATRAIATPQPNIVYILADDLGYSDCGFNGGTEIQTPNLNKLAADGAILRSFYAQSKCSPTRASLLSGRYVSHTGVYSVVNPNSAWGLPLNERTLAQALKQAGYETAISGKWHLGESSPEYLPTKRGFDHQYGLWFGTVDHFTHLRDGVLDWHRNDQPSTDQGYSTHLIAQEACRVIKERDTSKPFFLYLPFNAVHVPLQVPDSYLQPYGQLQGTRKTFAGMLSAMDEAVGHVVAALDEAHLRNNTLIVFSSDNGGPHPGQITDNGPLRAGKGTIYEGGVRVCAFANWPGKIPANTIINEPLHIIDWYPTLLKLGGGSLEQPLPIDGKDIWPVITQGAKSPHDAILLSSTKPSSAAVRMGDWKLLLNASDKDAEGPKNADDGKATYALYNLADDLSETKNLAETNPAKLTELKQRLDELLKDAVPPGDRGLATKKSKK